MRRGTLAALVATLTVALVGTSAALAARENGNRLTCFAGLGGTCTLTEDGSVLDNSTGGFSGAYLQNSNLEGKVLAVVNRLSFRYSGSAPGAGAPRVSLPIDTGSGTTAFYAFIAAFYCNDGAGLVDALNDPTCTIFAGSEAFSSWGALLAAHPDWRVGPNLPFVIADETGNWTGADVQLGKGPATGA